MEPGPRRDVRGQRAIVVAARVVHIPEQRLRIETVLCEPGGERQPIERFIFVRQAIVEWYRETPGRSQRGSHLAEPAELVAVNSRQPDRRFDPFLPSPVDDQPLLLIESTMAL